MNEAETSTTISSAAKLMNPIYHMDPFLYTIQIGVSLIGIPLNLLVAGTIVFNRQLQANQNIAWLGCGFANVLCLSTFLIEVAAAAGNSSVFLTLFNSIFGLPQACLVLYLHLSFLDRYLFFKHTLFYKKYANRAWIVAIQIICFVLVFLLIKGRFFYESLTRSLLPGLTEKDISIMITSVFIAAVLLYVPSKQFQETYIYRKQSKGNKTVLKNNFNSIESKSTPVCFENTSDDHEHAEDKASNSLVDRFDHQSDEVDENSIHDKPNNEDREINQDNFCAEKNADNTTVDSFGSPDCSSTYRLQQSNECRDANNCQDKATCTNLDENKEGDFSVSGLQSYCSIKINIKVLFILIIIQLIFFALSLFCLQFAIIDGFLLDSCSTWFLLTCYLRGILFGFYTAMFNPLCFVGNSHDFVTLENTRNPIGRIARAIRCITYLFANPKITFPYKHIDAVATMV